MTLDRMMETIQSMMAADGAGAQAETFQSLHEAAQSVAGEMTTMQQQMADKETAIADMAATHQSQIDEILAQATATQEAFHQELAAKDDKLSAMMASMHAAMAAYKAAVLAANPEVPEELVDGYTIEDINAALEKAKTIVDKIKQKIEQPMPTGAPARGQTDTSALTAKEKIMAGLNA